VSTDRPDLTEPHDPALDGLFRALTADGTAGELAGRTAALEMFRDSQAEPPRFRPHQVQPGRLRQGHLRQGHLRQGHLRQDTRPRRLRPPRFRLAVSMGTAAATLVLAGGISAAYAAALPAPVQHIAYRMLGRIGVPDAHPSAPAASASRPAAVVAPTTSAPATAGCPCPASGPASASSPDLTLAAALAQIPAGGDEILSGRLASGGRSEAGVRVRLFEHVAGQPGWRVAGSAVTGASGQVTLTVDHLTSNASFRLAARRGTVSAPVLVTVIPRVSLRLARGQAGMDVLTARAPYAQAGDPVVLQERAGGRWYSVGERALGPDHLATFSVLIPASGHLEYRVIMPRTRTHGPAASGPVRIGARTRGRSGELGRVKTVR
jgi:hypothetical protein